jgi:hypothetical protein
MNSNLYRTTRNVMLGVILGCALTLTSTIVGMQQADAAPPYGGCKEAWQAPQSEGADWCRDRGWTVRKRVVLNPHAVLRYWNLDPCTYEDGSGQTNVCGWLGNKDGNGRGLSYYITGPEDQRTGHFLWSPNPLTNHPKRQWVDSGLADALAEGSAYDATTRDWNDCWVKYGKQTTTVACPDGYTEEW